MSSNISVGIDIGSTKVITCVGKVEGGVIDILGLGKSTNLGIRKGVIVDIEETVSAITASLEEAERMAGLSISQATVGISGPTIKSEISKGVIAISRGDGEIGQEDVDRAIESARAIANKPNREIMHTIPLNYIIDSNDNVKDPVGMTGIRLEVNANIVSVGVNSIKSIKKSVEQAGVEVADLIFAPLATARVLLSKRQMEIGVLLVDIGAATTSYAVFEDGEMIHCGVIPVGSMHITNDLAIGLRTSIEIADMIKLKFGCASPDKVDEKEEIMMSKFDKNDENVVSLRYIAEIIEARLSEIFSIIKDNLAQIDREGSLPAGLILTGGGSKLAGLVEMAKETMRLPVQIGTPNIEISGLIDKLADPVYSTGIGLMLCHKGKIQGGTSFNFDVQNMNLNSIVGKIKDTFKNFLP